MPITANNDFQLRHCYPYGMSYPRLGLKLVAAFSVRRKVCQWCTVQLVITLTKTIVFYFRIMIDASNSRHPRDAASFVSRVTMWWIFPLLWKGYQKPLNHEDLYPVRDVEKSKRRTKLLEEKWGEEVLHAQNRGGRPKLWRAFLRYYTWQEYFYFLPFCLCAVVGDNLKCYATITLLNKLISFNNETREEYFVYVYAIALGCLLHQIGQNIVCFCGVELGVRARAALLGLLYKKVCIRWLNLCH